MTRIMTLCSGLARVGKTHLAINLAFEMARRGRQAAIFSQGGSHSPIDDLLALPQTEILQRRSTDHADALVRRGYMGIDLLSTGIALSQWHRAPGESVQKNITAMDCVDGYDDFLIDTSGMNPRTLLACCRASTLLILVVTADPRCMAETFALLRILQLNGYQGSVYALFNQLDRAVNAHEHHHAFNGIVAKHLGLDIPLLGGLVRDIHVQRAERSKQAFTSLFPDAEISGQVVAVVDALDAVPSAETVNAQGLAAYWNRVLELLALPVALPGGVFLKESDEPDDPAAIPPALTRESGSEVMLLQLDSSFHGFGDALDSLPGLLEATAEDVSSLRHSLDAADAEHLYDERHATPDSSDLLQLAVRLIREVEQAVVPAQVLQLQVNESRVRGDDPDWLQTGCYLKYIFHFQGQEAVLSRIRSFLAGVGGIRQAGSEADETLWEMVVADRSGGMNIMRSADDGIRIQLWLPLRNRPKTDHQGQPPRVVPMVHPGKTIH